MPSIPHFSLLLCIFPLKFPFYPRWLPQIVYNPKPLKNTHNIIKLKHFYPPTTTATTTRRKGTKSSFVQQTKARGKVQLVLFFCFFSNERKQFWFSTTNSNNSSWKSPNAKKQRRETQLKSHSFVSFRFHSFTNVGTTCNSIPNQMPADQPSNATRPQTKRRNNRQLVSQLKAIAN